MKPIHERIDDILVDPGSRTEENPDGSWSSVRLFLLMTLGTFLYLSYWDPRFRDVGAFVTIILALIGSVVAPKLLDLRVAIGQAAASIARRFTKKEETLETDNATVTTTETESHEPAEPVVRRGE